MTRSSITFQTRTVAAFMAALAIMNFRTRSAWSDPADIFSSPAPAIQSDQPKAADLKTGDASVSTQTGALQYSYPITVPPGRNGAAPQLALAYSSQAAIYGGIASGWSLSIPQIAEDTSQGRLRTHSPEVETTQFNPKGDDRFASSMAGGRPLVLVAEPTSANVYGTYRAQNDASFARYERMDQAQPYRWRVYTTDGTTWYFGNLTRTIGCNPSDGFAPLTGVVDAFGNEIKYEYESAIAGECRIKRISWGFNGPANLNDFAQVTFGYAAPSTCVGVDVGSQRDYRSGRLRVTGASKLLTITSIAFAPGSENTPEHTRVVTLGYDTANESCSLPHAPVRLLTSIQESAWGSDSPRVDLRPVTFEYGNATIDLRVDQPASNGTPWNMLDPHDNALAWGYRFNDARWPSVEGMLLDLDGDGLLDRVRNTSAPQNDGSCVMQWQRNRGTVSWPSRQLQFAPPQPITLPRLKWRGPGSSPPAGGAGVADPSSYEGCSLNRQITAYANSHSAFNVCHDGITTCSAGGTCPDGTECPPGAGNSPLTFLAYRWLDMDADGLPDLVASVHGDSDTYDIVQGNNTFAFESGATLGLPASPDLAHELPACPSAATMERCKAVSTSCMNASGVRSCTIASDCTYNWTAINSCMGAAALQGCYSLVGENSSNFFGAGPQTTAPYTRCDGLYPWFIYMNQGNGVIATTPVVKYQPIPLESDTGDSSVYSPSVSTANHGVLDFDGDGVLDAIAHPKATTTDFYWWFVWLGDGTGGFLPRSYAFATRGSPNNHVSKATIAAGSSLPQSAEGLFDLNGDGLQDHWSAVNLGASGQYANVALHDGTTHRLIGAIGSNPPIGELSTPMGVKPGNDISASNVTFDPPDTQQIASGTQWTTNRLIDIDNDGRADVLKLNESTGRSAFFNAGGQFMTTGVIYGGNDTGFTRKVVAATDGAPQPPSLIGLTWKLSEDIVDLDGNGIPEAVWWTGPAAMARGEHDPFAAPPRLMKAVHDGRGLHTAVAYGSLHDKTAVEQPLDAIPTWPDGRPKATPSTQWVVKSLTVTDDFAGTSSTTSQFYRNPRHGADDQGHYAFRGFEEVITTSPSNARTIQRYGYTAGAAGGDWSGQLVETLVVPGETGTYTPGTPVEVRSIDRTTWTSRQLFGTVVTFHPTTREHLTCKNGQTDIGATACTATSAAAYSKTTSFLSALNSTTQGGVSLLWQETNTLLQAGTSNADGDRQTLSTFALATGSSFGVSTVYRLRPLVTTRQHRTGGAWVTFGKSEQAWDSTFSVPLADAVWFGSPDQPCTPTSSYCAIAKRVYDMTTGNVTERWKPMQNSAGTTKSALAYDARKLFVAHETNELNHPFDYTYEYGTGTRLTTTGPNVRSCTTQPICVNDALHPVRETRKIRVDGLGRPIERWETTSPDGLVYTLQQFGRTTYFEGDAAASPRVPASVLQENALDFNGSWKKEKAELDGHGRPSRKTLFAQGSAPSDHVTTFHYRNDGMLDAVSVPDPTQNNASLVTYTYGFDSLGRPTSIRRPDATSTIDQSGVNIAYDGVTKTVTEVVGVAGGTPASTKTITDSFGRLIEVHEQTVASPATWAITRYTYGPDDLMTRIVDPEQVTTDLTHDLDGRRTQITRYGRAWKYSYDKNGNVIAEQAPGSPNPPLTDPNFTNTVAYDDLDRPVSKVIAPRDLTLADRQLFTSGTETYTWDIGANHIGFLRYWSAYAPNATTPDLREELFNDNQGRRTITKQTLSIAGYPSMTRSFQQSYRPFGGIQTTQYHDQMTVGGPSTNSTINYDNHGLPSAIQLVRGGLADPDYNIQLASFTRNIAGLVTKRRSVPTGGPMTFIESSWTYDKLSRVTSQVVQKGPGPVQVVRQDLAYFGNDDPKTLDHYLGNTPRYFQYTYDRRHQLTSAQETLTPGYYSGTFSYSTGGRLATVNQSQTATVAGSEFVSRDVTYLHDDPDPERVTSLVNASSTTPFATYQFDAAGNQTTRCYGATTNPACAGESMTFIYEGKNQLRRATKRLNGVAQGSEEYWYGGEGERIAVLKRDSSGAKTEMVWFIGDVEAHYDPLGAITHVYFHPSVGTPVARIDRTSNSDAPIEFQFHGIADHMLAGVSYDGAVNAAFAYAPFGEVLASIDAGGNYGSAEHHRRINNKNEDGISGLSYYGARYYDKIALQWTQSDPAYRMRPEVAWTQPRRAALYVMSLNNMLRYLDPDGQNADAIALIGGAARVGIAVISLPVVIVVGTIVVSVNVANHPPPAATGGGVDIGTDGTGCGSYCVPPAPNSDTGITVAPIPGDEDPMRGWPKGIPRPNIPSPPLPEIGDDGLPPWIHEYPDGPPPAIPRTPAPTAPDTTINPFPGETPTDTPPPQNIPDTGPPPHHFPPTIRLPSDGGDRSRPTIQKAGTNNQAQAPRSTNKAVTPFCFGCVNGK